MYVTARTTYAMRALVAMARARPATISAPALAEAEKMPFTFLQTILGELRRARLVVSQRGNDGGYRLARPGDPDHGRRGRPRHGHHLRAVRGGDRAARPRRRPPRAWGSCGTPRTPPCAGSSTRPPWRTSPAAACPPTCGRWRTWRAAPGDRPATSRST
ncbi:RrF2 family transcriptional regulator [Actinomadura madurae]|uniref:RrF2 family transcriptional regulator n=1 Tax=Actinomadura madurae TaxID=1993 RepID=UPI0020D21CD7|nr:Rrf2 family transcriptional regulator [Actinomadura madurae]MCP9983107.1 Rrf2 family transcriptional regulator [Actinomadura madurae]